MIGTNRLTGDGMGPDLAVGEPRRPDEPSSAALAAVREAASAVERFIVQYPGATLTAAFAAGVVVAWWIKRK
jgi:hypothetical protein